jgi:hypothetical protein
MKKSIAMMAVAALLGVVGFPGDLAAKNSGKTYKVTVTNLTRGQSFTPILVVSHRYAPNLLFVPGETASPELAMLAEGGDTGPLETVLSGNPRVRDTATSAGLLEPGDSTTIEVQGQIGLGRISLAAMLIPTNDAFLAAQNVRLPSGHEVVTVVVPAYDAGSEPNDEDCANIPGPVCGGEGVSEGGGEGYVHVHAGIHGIGTLAAETYDWRNPVASISIKMAR